MIRQRPRMTQADHVDVVVVNDPAIEAAWSDEERARYQLLGERPAEKVIPADATRFRIRPMGWMERRAQRDAAAERFTPRGIELLNGYIDAMADAHRPPRLDPVKAGEAFRQGLSPDDRRELAQATVASMHADEELCAACVVEVVERGHGEPWADVLEQAFEATKMISQVARHIRRISNLGAKPGF